MRTLMVRCVKVTAEEKKTRRHGVDGIETLHTVDCVFEAPELEQIASAGTYVNCYLSVTLTPELHRELGYEVGKVYELGPT